MKRAICCMLIALFIISCTTGCDEYEYDGWQTIYIEDYGTLKIPSDWKSYVEDDYLYIVDANDNPIMIQTYSYCGYYVGEEGKVESNKFVENFQCVKGLSSNALSNSTTYGKVEILQGSEKSEHYYIELNVIVNNEGYMRLIVWDSSIDEETVKKIAASFDGSNHTIVQ